MDSPIHLRGELLPQVGKFLGSMMTENTFLILKTTSVDFIQQSQAAGAQTPPQLPTEGIPKSKLGTPDVRPPSSGSQTYTCLKAIRRTTLERRPHDSLTDLGILYWCTSILIRRSPRWGCVGHSDQLMFQRHNPPVR